MTVENGDKRPPMAVAVELASQVITIALMMALPAGGGHWLDQRFGTSPLLVIVGAVVGMGAGMTQLWRWVGRTGKKPKQDLRKSGDRDCQR
jgi:F0F1-type ATP synthase assembly protein I